MNRAAGSVLAAALAAILVGGVSAGFASAGLGVYVVAVDGLDPSEVGPATPRLSEPRSSRIWYENARVVMIAETLPNHVAMMTGVLPRKNGIVANDYRAGRMSAPEEARSRQTSTGSPSR